MARKKKPPSTPEGLENHLISLASKLAEKQLKDGTASAQVITHYLKMADGKHKLEMEKIKHENELLKAKSDSIANAQSSKELYQEAIKAFGTYRGD